MKTKQTKKGKKNHRTQEYLDCTEEFNGKLQQQKQPSRIKNW